MSPIRSTARSGLDAASMQLGAAAHNIANAQTEGFQRQRVELQSKPSGGVTGSVQMLPQAGANQAEDWVAGQRAAYLFKANLRVVQTEDELLGSLLDVRA